jgi:L-fuculose-phosphate aldolase
MALLDKYSNEVDQFIKVCHRLASLGYVTAFGGNCALRLESDRFLITPTQTYKGDVTRESVVIINQAGDRIEGSNNPTGEKPMYLRFFSHRPDVKSIIHCHPPTTCAFAISSNAKLLMRPLYPETTTEIGPVPLVSYARPLTEALADSFTPYILKYDSFLMKNHGIVTLNRGSLEWTMHMIELLESTAQSIAIAASIGEIEELSRKDVSELSIVMKTRNLPLFGAPGVNKTLEEMYYQV